MPESLYGAHPKKLPVRFKLPSHLDLLRFQHAKVKVGSTDHFTCLIRISLNLKNDQKNRPHDPDAALATMPAKTQEVKKKEADDRAHWAESSRRIDKLRQHKLIGTSLDDFLKEYSGARLINSS